MYNNKVTFINNDEHRSSHNTALLDRRYIFAYYKKEDVMILAIYKI